MLTFLFLGLSYMMNILYCSFIAAYNQILAYLVGEIRFGQAKDLLLVGIANIK